MKLEIIADFLVAGGFGTIGTDIFLYEMPPDCKKGILIRMPPDSGRIDYYLPGYFKHTVQVIVRDQVHQDGHDLSDLLQTTLNFGRQQITTASGSITFNFMRLGRLPVRYPRSAGNGIEWSLNFDACYCPD